MLDGDWVLRMLRLNRATLFAVVLSAFAQQAVAAERRDFDVPAGRLGDALIAIGRQAGVTVGTTFHRREFAAFAAATR